MTDYFFLIPIAIALFIGVVSPGPSFLLVAQTAVSKSRKHGIAVSLGMGVGSTIFALLASIGLYVVLENVPVFYILLKVAGGLYLCFLAYKIWINAAKSINKEQAANQAHSKNIVKSFALGIVTQMSNPKTAIVFGGVFAAFLPLNPPEYSYIFLCLLAFFIDSGWYIVVSIVLSTQRAQHIYSLYQKGINRLASGFMGLMGIKLISNQ
jgi:threonine/homoserine/homoserine lactone efflux protein